MLKIIINILVNSILLITSFNASSQNKVVVIPLAGDIVNPSLAKTIEDLTSSDNIVTVAKQGGNFTDPVAAMASITASAANPYLLFIAPGVFTLSDRLVMKEYVDIIGSGRNVTKLTGAISVNDDSTSALVLGANHASLKSLSIENTGGSTHSYGVYNGATSPRMSDMSITASGADNLYGVYNGASSSPMIYDVVITAVDGNNYNFGVYNFSTSSPSMTNVTITASGGSIASYGIYNISSSPSINNTTITASGGGFSSYGVYHTSSTSSARIQASDISATTNSVWAGGGSGANETYISNSILDSAVGGGPKCFSTFLDDGTGLDGNCQP